MTTNNTSAITRELFQLKERIDQLTFKQGRALLPGKKEQIQMKLEGLKRTQRGLKHIRMLLYSASTPKPPPIKEQAVLPQPQVKKVEQAAAQDEPTETQAVSQEKVLIKVGGCKKNVASTTSGDKCNLQLIGLVDQIQRLRVAMYQHVQKYKPLQIIKVFIAFWFLSSFCISD